MTLVLTILACLVLAPLTCYFCAKGFALGLFSARKFRERQLQQQKEKH